MYQLYFYSQQLFPRGRVNRRSFFPAWMGDHLPPIDTERDWRNGNGSFLFSSFLRKLIDELPVRFHHLGKKKNVKAIGAGKNAPTIVIRKTS